MMLRAFARCSAATNRAAALRGTKSFNKQLAIFLRIRSRINNCAGGRSDDRKRYARNNDDRPAPTDYHGVPHPMTWLSASETDKAIIQEIETQTDRAAALIAVAYLEERLRSALDARTHRH